MREIKFRGMDANGNMRYGRLSQDKPNSTVYYTEYSQRICWDDCNIPVKNSTLGQYTGLKDKNGKEIYEGDIVAWQYDNLSPRHTALITFDGKLAIFKADLLPEKREWRWVSSDWEIIGNIYENPELIQSLER